MPFTIRNYKAFDQFVLLNTNAGYAIFWGNHPVHGTQFISADEDIDYKSLIPEELLSLDEASLDKKLLKLGISFVTDDPIRYIKLSLSRISDYFRFWPSERSGLLSNISRVLSFGIFFPFMLYGLFLSLRTDLNEGIKEFLSSPQLLLYLFMLVYTGIHLVTWAMIRYRLPVDAVLILFASLAFVDIFNRFSRLLEKTSP